MENIIGAALTYMYFYIHHGQLGLNCNTCFSGYGKTISPEKIVDIIIL